MPSNFAIRIHAPSEQIKKSLGLWSSVCEKILAYEHDSQNRVHTHLLVLGCQRTSENLKDMCRSVGLSLKGNGEWSFKNGYTDKASKKKVELTEHTMDRYVVYMSKGKYDPYYNKGFDPEYVNRMRAEWVAPDPNKSRDSVIYDDFAKVMGVQELTWDQVARMARNYSINRHGKIVSAVALKEAKMLALTYCYRWEITINWDKIKW